MAALASNAALHPRPATPGPGELPYRMSTPHADAATRQAAAAEAPIADALTPADRYQELFIAVQREQVFPDSKTFVDCAPRSDPAAILSTYRAESVAPGFDLKAFVTRHFKPERHRAQAHVSATGQQLVVHIDELWPELTRQPREHPRAGSLLPMPHPYVVPGGRFAEQYYWDSYFTMLGLAEGGRGELVHAMTDNFAYLIDTWGHIPNGNRTYYLSRSQPPVFVLMTELCEAQGGPGAARYLPQLRREHAWWTDGDDGLQPGQTHRRVVALPDGARLNRYWDDRDTPREEAWREDVATAARSDRPQQEVWRHLRAAAESGWDFSSRWLREADDPAGAPSDDLATICTTDIVPVDLNALLHKLETTIARLAHASGDTATGQEFDSRAERRRAAMDRWLWNAAAGAYADFDHRLGRLRHALTAATVVPLFCGVASPAQADAVAAAVRQRLLAHGGLSTTEWRSGQQWDRPNGWAPLQWMGVLGFERTGHADLADLIRTRWVRTVGDVYRREGKLVEKYALRHHHGDTTQGGHGGEYPLQDGFGWTNGVTRRWLHEMPAHDVCVGDAEPAPSTSGEAAQPGGV